MALRERVIFDTDQATRRTLKAAAALDGKTISQFCHAAINNSLETHPIRLAEKINGNGNGRRRVRTG